MMPPPSPKRPRTPVQTVCPDLAGCPTAPPLPALPCRPPAEEHGPGRGGGPGAGFIPKDRNEPKSTYIYIFYFYYYYYFPPHPGLNQKLCLPGPCLAGAGPLSSVTRDAGDTKGWRWQRCFLKAPKWVSRLRGLTCSLCFCEDLDDVPGPGDGAFQAPWGCLCRAQSVSQGPFWGQGLTHRRVM